MEQRGPDDIRDSLTVVAWVSVMVAVFIFGPFLFHHYDGPLWKNIYVFSASNDPTLNLVLMTPLVINRTQGRSPRVWLSCFAMLCGLTGIAMAVSYTPDIIPHFGVGESFMNIGIGVVYAAVIRDGIPRRAWRNLFGKNIDYARRLFPMVGSVACLALFGLWVWDMYQRWTVHDYTAATDAACFVLGVMGVLIRGKSRSAVPATGNGASCAI